MSATGIGSTHTKQGTDQVFIEITAALDALNTRMVNLAKYFAQTTADEVARDFDIDTTLAQQYIDGAEMLGQIPVVALGSIPGLDAFLALVRKL